MAIDTIAALLDAIPHERFIGSAQARRRSVRGFSTDTRSLKTREVFVALEGERFDAHNFLAQVAGRAAAAVVASSWVEAQSSLPDDLPLVVVADTLETYGAIASAHRSAFTIPVIAIAGSNGKTTTKDLAAAVLSRRYSVLATEGNLNNLIGVPATMLRMRPEHQVAVVEIGTNMPGEIARLCQVLRPTHGVITNIGREHLELLGSIEGVAEEEGALFEYLASSGATAFVNADDPYVQRRGRKVKNRISYGRTARADIWGTVESLDERSAPKLRIVDRRTPAHRSITVQLGTPGMHTALNALAAATIGVGFGVPLKEIRSALEEFSPRHYSSGYGRLSMMNLPSGARLLNDTYNSNPESVSAALETLAAMKPGDGGRRIAVLADMREMGEHAPEEHRNVGHQIARGTGRVDIALFYGQEMRHACAALEPKKRQWRDRALHFESKDQLAEHLLGLITANDVVLVKGSRGLAMEDVVGRIMKG